MHDTIIIGAGIAGCTAAIYASRKRMDFAFISKDFGGQFMESGEVLNYPGIKKTTGAKFASTMREQLDFNGVKLASGVTAQKIERKTDNFVVRTDKGDYETKSVIIATGARARHLGVPGEAKLKNRGVAYCAICDGPLFSGKDVAVVGGGNSALEAVDFLLGIAKKIYLINIGKKLIAHEYLKERIKGQQDVTVINEAKTTKILGKDLVEGLQYTQDSKTKKIDVEGVFIEIGRVPNTEFIKGFCDLDEHGHITIDCQTNTSVKGVFAVGDCSSVHEYQYVIAAGQGCVALIKAARYIAGKKEA